MLAKRHQLAHQLLWCSVHTGMLFMAAVAISWLAPLGLAAYGGAGFISLRNEAPTHFIKTIVGCRRVYPNDIQMCTGATLEIAVDITCVACC